MEKEDEIRLRKSVQSLKEWANREGRCALVIAGDEEGGFAVCKHGNFLRLAESIANAIRDKPTLIFAMKLGVEAAEEYNRQKEEKKNKS